MLKDKIENKNNYTKGSENWNKNKLDGNPKFYIGELNWKEN